MDKEKLLKEFIEKTPEIFYLIEHYPKQARFLWKLFEFENKIINKTQ